MTKVTHVLRWLGEKNGNQLARSHEPDTPWWLRAWVQIVRKVPGIERFL